MTEVMVEIKNEKDIVAARRAGRDLAGDLGFGLAEQTRLATTISELARNALQHAGEGVCLLTTESDERSTTIRVTIEDHGPGIPDIEKAMTPGFSTEGSLGAGLPGAKKLVDELQIESSPGHTRVAVAMARQNP